MKLTIELDDQFFQQAKEASGALTDAEVIHQGLQALIRHQAYQQLAALRGSEKHARDVPRRREKPARKRKVA